MQNENLNEYKKYVPTYCRNLEELLKEFNGHPEKYKPLSREKETALILQYKDTNKELLKKILIERNVYIAVNLLKHQLTKSNDTEAMIQDAFYGLVYSAEVYDFESYSSLRFQTYAYYWIKKYIFMPYQDRYTKYMAPKMTSFDAPSFPNDTGGANDGIDGLIMSEIFSINDEIAPEMLDNPVITTSAADVYEKENQEKSYKSYYEKMLNAIETSGKFSSDEKFIFNSVYILNNRLKDIADNLSMSVSNVKHKKDRILKKLKDIMKYNYGVCSFQSLN